VLEPGDDAASENWEGRWRTPTDEEWTWLRGNCTWTKTTDYLGTGKVGMIVTSNVAGFEASSIFLPAAGEYTMSGLTYSGSSGHYWSSSLYTDFSASYALTVVFESGPNWSFEIRYCRLSIRPVAE
jgi:hypothetical protein